MTEAKQRRKSPKYPDEFKQLSSNWWTDIVPAGEDVISAGNMIFPIHCLKNFCLVYFVFAAESVRGMIPKSGKL